MWTAFDPPFWRKLRMNAIAAYQCQSFPSVAQPAWQLRQIHGSPPSSSIIHLLFGGVWWVSEVNEVTMEPFTSVCFQILDVDTDSCISSWDCSWFTNMAHFQRFPCGSSSHNGSYSTRQGSKYIYPKYTRTWRLGKEPQGGTHCETDFGQNSIYHLVSTGPVYTEGHNGIQGSLESFSVQSFYPTVLKNSGYVYCIYLWQQGFFSKRPGLPLTVHWICILT